MTFATRRITLLMVWTFFATSCGLQAQGITPLLVRSTLMMKSARRAFGPAGGHIRVAATLPAATVGTPYNAVVSVSGGRAPYQFAIGIAMLPPGLTLNAQTGTISGTPITAGSYYFSVVVTDLPRADYGNHRFTIGVAASSGNGTSVSVAISPTSASVYSGGTRQLTATVSGTSDTAVTWSASAGTISSAGLFTAPSVTSPQSATVTATSSATAGAQASASIVVNPNMLVAVSPATASVVSGGTQQFTASVSGTSNVGVTWSASAGTVSNSGLFNAPTVTVATTVTVTATSLADPTKSALATVSVNPPGSSSTVNPPSSGCGPPTYNCSSQSTTLATIPATPNMGGQTGVNSTGYAYSSPSDFYYPSSGVGNCITRLTDANSDSNVDIGSTWSSGGNDLIWSPDRSYGGVEASNGRVFYISVSYTAAGCMQINNPVLNIFSPGGTLGGFSFSRVTRNVAYHILGNSGNGTVLNQETLSGTQSFGPNQLVISNTTVLFDFGNCPGLPSPFKQTWSGQLGVSASDNIFTAAFSKDGNQGTGLWVVSWNKTTNQCATWYTGQVQTAENPANGNIWAYCGPGNCSQGGSNPAPLALNTTCAQPGFGIHGVQQFHDGNALAVSGTCNGVVNSLTLWIEIGTNNLTTCNGSNNGCAGHNSTGYSNMFNVTANPIKHPYTHLASITTLGPSGFGNTLDQHGSFQWTDTTDLNPWLVSTIVAAKPGCNPVAGTASVYCKELEAFRQDNTVSRFTPDFTSKNSNEQFQGQFAISTMTPDGYCMIWASDWNGTLGLNSAGTSRVDVFSICNLQ